MTDFFDPYDADRPLLLKCSCGKDHTEAEHQKELTASRATSELRQRSLSSEFEAYSNEFIEATLVKALFPQDEVRRRFLFRLGLILDALVYTCDEVALDFVFVLCPALFRLINLLLCA